MFDFKVYELKDGTTVAGLEGDVCYVTTFTPNSSYYAYHTYIDGQNCHSIQYTNQWGWVE